MCCAKMAKPIETQFGILSQVGPGNTYYMKMKMPPWEGTFGCLTD